MTSTGGGDPQTPAWSGVVKPGSGVCSQRMAADPALSASFAPLGFTPYPGSLNLKIERRVGRAIARAVEPVSCRDAYKNKPFPYYPVHVNGYPCWVRVYAHHLEAVAPVRLRDELGVKDADRVTITPRSL